MKNRLLIFGLALFAFLLALDRGLRSETFSERIRPIVTSYLQESLGQKVIIGGVRAGLVPPHLEIRDVFLQDDHQVRVLVSIRKVRAYLNPLPLLIKRISLTSIVFVEPQLIVEKRGKTALDGLSYFQDRFRELRGPGQPSQEISPRVIVHAVIIRNGTIVYHDALAGSRYAVRKLTARVHREGSDGLSGRLLLHNADITINTPALPDLRMSARAKCGYSAGKLSLETFSV
ncbi:MAG TPA: AsmA family protein, partial [Nitrospirota bacterium]|nr:AsmA family protein [Nitrospirota bacterium]